MKPVDHVNLAELTNEAKLELLNERKTNLRIVIKRIVGDVQAAHGTVRNLEGQLSKAKEALAKKQKQLEDLEAGNWDSLPEEERPKQAPPKQEA